jgi:photosystem II stability/assembly factor-like uncharacterized protein
MEGEKWRFGERTNWKKIFGLLVVFLLAASSFVWAADLGGSNSVSKLMRNSDIFGVACVKKDIWAVSVKGSVFHSPDLGKSWELHDTGVDNELYSVSFVDNQEGWAVGRFGIILHTSDGGRHWDVQQREVAEKKANLFAVKFVTTERGWAVGEWATILRTEDGGKTWQNHPLGIDKFLWGISVVDSTHVWVVGETGIIASSVDGGKTWTEQKSPAGETTLFGVFFKDRMTGWACGMDGLIILTKDGGKTWHEIKPRAASVPLYRITQVGNKLWAVGRNGVILNSIDGGLTWRRAEKTPLVFNWLIDIASNSDTIILGGEKGTLLVSTNGGESWWID